MRIGSLRNTNARFYTLKPLHWVDPDSPNGITVLGIKIGNRAATQSNYYDILEKLQNIVAIWDRRSISVIGKVTLINTLMCSITVYKVLMSLAPTDQFCDLFKKNILDFLWSFKKPHRLRYSKIILSKWNGGLGLIDIKTKNIALKASWVPRILKSENQFFAKILYYNLPVQHSWIWECNITRKMLKQIVEENIWMQIWLSWADYGYQPPYNYETVLLQVLWYNAEILHLKKPWYSPDLAQVGIIRVQDIFDEATEQFLTYQQACRRFNTRLNVLHYNAVLVAIPAGWKQMLQIYTPVEPTLIDRIHKKPKPPSFLCNLARNNFKDQDWCLEAWKRDFPTKTQLLTSDFWNQMLVQVHSILNQVELSFFQYRIIHRILTTNLLRSKWDQEVDYRCTFCKQQSETILHIFGCVKVQPIWNFIKAWLHRLIRVDIELDDFMIIFNNYKGPQRTFVNTVLLYTKHFIYASKCKMLIPHPSQIIPKLIDCQNVEKLAATRNGTLSKHEKKWLVFDTWLSPQ